MSLYMPWWLWVALFIVSVYSATKWLIVFKNEIPVWWKIGFGISFSFTVALASIDNIIRGTGVFAVYSHIISRLTLPSAIAMLAFLYYGAYKNLQSPSYNPVKKRGLLLGILACNAIALICAFYVYYKL